MAKINIVDEILRLHRLGASTGEISRWLNVDKEFASKVIYQARKQNEQ